MNDRDRVRLRHMLDAAREAVSFVEGRSRLDLAGDRLFLLAVVKEIEIIGEAASQISPETRSETAGIPWPKTTSLPPLITEMEKVLGMPAGPD